MSNINSGNNNNSSNQTSGNNAGANANSNNDDVQTSTINNTNINDGNQYLCIKRSESGLSSVFEDMYHNERLVDVTLSCTDGQLQAHKLVLAASSPYFSGLFERLANPFHYPVVVIKDMRIDDLRLMVEFMYKGQLTLSHHRLISLVKNAESLHITGLSNLDTNNISTMTSNDGSVSIVTVEAPRVAHHPSSKSKRARRTVTSLLNHNQVIFERTYHHSRIHNQNNDNSPDKLLEQSMITGDSIDGNNQQFIYATSSSKGLGHSQHLQSMPTTSLQIQQSMGIDTQHQQNHHNQISNQLQVLSHSLTTNRTSLSTQHSSMNGQSNNNHDNGANQSTVPQQPHRGRVHPCNICWKTFRERANLKRHLQVHSLDRVMYACLDCNKTFSWKDNYIRHTKTAHHINNARQQAS